VTPAAARLTAAGTAAAVVAADQATKVWAVSQLQGQPSIQVFGDLLQWTFATNSGAAFSLGAGSTTWIFTAIAAVVMVVLVRFIRLTVNPWWALSFGLLFGGAMGNFIDRWIRPPYGGQGHVIDFIHVPNWPIFNIADMAVVTGAFLMFVLSVRNIDYRGRTQEPAAQPAPTAVQ
jgi:signal peptidase II